MYNHFNSSAFPFSLSTHFLRHKFLSFFLDTYFNFFDFLPILKIFLIDNRVILGKLYEKYDGLVCMVLDTHSMFLILIVFGLPCARKITYNKATIRFTG